MKYGKRVANTFFSQRKQRYVSKRVSHLETGIIWLLCSREATEKSDIDLLVEFEDDIDIFETKFLIRNFIKTQLGKEVDICREKYLKSYAKDEILSETIYVW